MEEFKTVENINILSVEDDSFNQELASAIFEEIENITVLQASNGRECMDILEKNDVDLVLLDLVMPMMNGLETLKAIKSNDSYHCIPVIIVTSEENERKSTYKLGANDFISKPYNPTELKLRVQNNLKIKKFCSIIDDIKDDRLSVNKMSDISIEKLKEALTIAENSQKELLVQLGNLAHKNDGSKNQKTSQRLGEYASLMSKLSGVNRIDANNIYYAMFIYDIGLLRISNQKISISKEYQKHPVLGLEVLEGLKNTNLIKMAKIITLNHHENFDGSGFPNGLKGSNIPILSRISSIVDYYDELTQVRIYDKDKLSPNDALELLKIESGKKFDPKLLEIFISNFNKIKDIQNKYSN